MPIGIILWKKAYLLSQVAYRKVQVPGSALSKTGEGREGPSCSLSVERLLFHQTDVAHAAVRQNFRSDNER